MIIKRPPLNEPIEPLPTSLLPSLDHLSLLMTYWNNNQLPAEDVPSTWDFSSLRGDPPASHNMILREEIADSNGSCLRLLNSSSQLLFLLLFSLKRKSLMCSLPFSCRRMFPTVRCSFSNLRLDRKYYVILDIVPCDNKRYRYAYHRSSWLVAGKADPPPPHRFYIHPDAPYTGEQLRKQVVSFEKVKLTNNEMDKNGQVSNGKRNFLKKILWRNCRFCQHQWNCCPQSSSPTKGKTPQKSSFSLSLPHINSQCWVSLVTTVVTAHISRQFLNYHPPTFWDPWNASKITKNQPITSHT